jgi:hypothetical protein
MVELRFSVPKAIKSFLEQQATKQGFPSVSAYLLAVLGDLQQRSEKAELEARLIKGLDSPLVEMTNQDWKSLEREICSDEAARDAS